MSLKNKVWYDKLIDDIGFEAMWRQLDHDTQCRVIEHLNKDGRISDEQYEAFFLSEDFKFVPKYAEKPGKEGEILKITLNESWIPKPLSLAEVEEILEALAVPKSRKINAVTGRYGAIEYAIALDNALTRITKNVDLTEAERQELKDAYRKDYEKFPDGMYRIGDNGLEYLGLYNKRK